MRDMGKVILIGLAILRGSTLGLAVSNGADLGFEQRFKPLKAFKIQLYTVNRPHQHDGEIPEMAKQVVRLFKQQTGIDDLPDFEPAKQGILTAAKQVDSKQRNMSDGTAFQSPEIGAHAQLNTYHKLLSVRFQEQYWIPNTKPLLQACYAAAPFTPEGLGGLVMALGLQKGLKSTPSAVYNDLFSYLVDFLDAQQDKADSKRVAQFKEEALQEALRRSMQDQPKAPKISQHLLDMSDELD